MDNMASDAAVNTVDLKIRHERSGTTRKVVLPLEPAPNWAALATAAEKRFDLSPGIRIGLRYVDQDGDLVTLNSQAELDELWQDINKGYKEKTKDGQCRRYVRVELIELPPPAPSSTAATATQIPRVAPAVADPEPPQAPEDEDEEWVKPDSELAPEKDKSLSSGYSAAPINADDKSAEEPREREPRGGYTVAYDSPFEAELAKPDEPDEPVAQDAAEKSPSKGKERASPASEPGLVIHDDDPPFEIPVTVHKDSPRPVDADDGPSTEGTGPERNAFEASIEDEEARQLAEAIRLSRLSSSPREREDGPSVGAFGASVSHLEPVAESAEETVFLDHPPVEPEAHDGEEEEKAPEPEFPDHLPTEDPPEYAGDPAAARRERAFRRPQLTSLLSSTPLAPFAARLESAIENAPPELTRALDDLWAAVVDVGSAATRAGNVGQDVREGLGEATRGWRGFAAGSRWAGGPGVPEELRGFRGGVHRFGGRGGRGGWRGGRGGFFGGRGGFAPATAREAPASAPEPAQAAQATAEPAPTSTAADVPPTTSSPAPEFTGGRHPCAHWFGLGRGGRAFAFAAANCGRGRGFGDHHHHHHRHDRCFGKDDDLFPPAGNNVAPGEWDPPVELTTCFAKNGERSGFCRMNHPTHGNLDNEDSEDATEEIDDDPRRDRGHRHQQHPCHDFADRHRRRRVSRERRRHSRSRRRHGRREERDGESTRETSPAGRFGDRAEADDRFAGRGQRSVPGGFDDLDFLGDGGDLLPNCGPRSRREDVLGEAAARYPPVTGGPMDDSVPDLRGPREPESVQASFVDEAEPVVTARPYEVPRESQQSPFPGSFVRFRGAADPVDPPEDNLARSFVSGRAASDSGIRMGSSSLLEVPWVPRPDAFGFAPRPHTFHPYFNRRPPFVGPDDLHPPPHAFHGGRHHDEELRNLRERLDAQQEAMRREWEAMREDYEAMRRDAEGRADEAEAQTAVFRAQLEEVVRRNSPGGYHW